MPQDVIIDILGLNTNPSYFRTPEGSLKTATNININAPNTASCRRGVDKYGDQLNMTSGEKVNGFFEYQDTLLIHYENKLARDTGSGTWSDYSGTYEKADSEIGIRGLTFKKSFFLATTAGVQRLDEADGSLRNAGIPKAINFTAATTGASGFFTNNKQIAYRILWKLKDANDIINLGAVSERVELANTTGGTRDVELTVRIPQGITTDYSLQVYRSGFSADQNTIANDELFLVYEASPTAGEISAKTMTFTDNMDDNNKGATIYTAPSQQGIIANNDQPPIAKELVKFKDHLFYANTQTRQRLYITLADINISGGIENDDYIEIDGVTYTAKASETVASGEFKLYSTGDAFDDVANTAKSLVNVINGYSSNASVYAYYVSGYDDAPGRILLEARNVEDDAFTVTSSDNSAWIPRTPLTSEAEVRGNRMYISKQYLSDSVPLSQYIDVGEDANANIMRAIALIDSIIIFTDDGNVYRMIGDDIASFQIELFNDTLRIWGPRTAQKVENNIYVFTNQGVVMIQDTGYDIKSFVIEDTLNPFLSESEYPNFKANAYGISYESDRKYILCYDRTFYVYNYYTDTWTTWSLTMDAGFVNPADDKIYIADTNGYVWQEKKDFTRYDYSDEVFNITISSSNLYTVTVTDATNISVGMSIKQAISGTVFRFARVTAISGNDLTVDRLQSWQAAAATAETPITCTLQWNPIFGKNPSVVKNFKECTVFFRDMSGRYTISFSNNFNGTFIGQDITPTVRGSKWGGFPWGQQPWGGAGTGEVTSRTLFPLQYHRNLYAFIKIVTEECFTEYSLNGLAVKYDYNDTRFTEQRN